MTTLTTIPIEQLHESPLNPRKRYDADALKELAASLAESGQIEAILVRPANGRGGSGYEIAAGHRRFRAAKLAGLTQLEAKVQDLDDRTLVEILNISNLQRDDLTPLDEAAGFRMLMEKAGYDVAKLAARIGLSMKYVYDRLKLLQLIPAGKKLLEEGTITAGHAIILARLSPTDQQRAIGDRDADFSAGWGGLFQDEQLDDPAFDMDVPQKPRSVRELQQWVNDNVRLTEDKVDPVLFPETFDALREAQQEKLKVVHITHDYQVPGGARDEHQRTYGEHSWKRADGKEKSKTCQHSAMGIVVAGPGRGEAFLVCTAKKTCAVHWKKEQQAAADAAKGGPGSADNYERERQRQEEARREQEVEKARWKKAEPKILQLLAAKVKNWRQPGATSELGRLILERCKSWRNKAALKYLKPGRSAEDLVRCGAFLILAEAFEDWQPIEKVTATCKRFGINAVKIVDQVAPKPTSEKKQAAKPPAKKKGKKKGGR